MIPLRSALAALRIAGCEREKGGREGRERSGGKSHESHRAKHDVYFLRSYSTVLCSCLWSLSSACVLYTFLFHGIVLVPFVFVLRVRTLVWGHLTCRTCASKSAAIAFAIPVGKVWSSELGSNSAEG